MRKWILIAALIAVFAVLFAAAASSQTEESEVTVKDVKIIPEIPIFPIKILPPTPPPKEMERGVDADLLSYDNFVEAGGTVVLRGFVRNLGSREITVRVVPIQEELTRWERRVVKPEWVTVSPSEMTLSGNEKREFSISVSVPEGTETGYYSGMLAIRTDRYPEKRLHYSIQVFKPMEEPIVKKFNVPKNASKILVKVRWHSDGEYYPMRIMSSSSMSSGEKPIVEVHLYDPLGTEIQESVKMTRISGYVDVFNMLRPELDEDYITYKMSHEEYTVTYCIENPTSGTWRLEMMPKGVFNFNYEIIVNPVDGHTKY